MATLAETGLHENIGAESAPRPVDEVTVALLHFPERYKPVAGTMFTYPAGTGPVEEGALLDFGVPADFIPSFAALRFVRNEPVFQGAYRYPWPVKTQAERTVMLESEADATIPDRDGLAPFVEAPYNPNAKVHARVLFGEVAVRSFAESSIRVLDIEDETPMSTDADGLPILYGDDVFASRIIQIAAAAGLDIHRQIPPHHTDRALREMVVSTLFAHYIFFDEDSIHAGYGGRWLNGCRDFTGAYGLSADEIADAILYFNEEAVGMLNSQPWRREKVRPFEPHHAHLLGDYMTR